MNYIEMQIDLLINHLLAGGVEKVNSVGATSRHEDLDFDYDEKAKYLKN